MLPALVSATKTGLNSVQNMGLPSDFKKGTQTSMTWSRKVSHCVFQDNHRKNTHSSKTEALTKSISMYIGQLVN